MLRYDMLYLKCKCLSKLMIKIGLIMKEMKYSNMLSREKKAKTASYKIINDLLVQLLPILIILMIPIGILLEL